MLNLNHTESQDKVYPLPCPFCGGAATIMRNNALYGVGCSTAQACLIAPVPFINFPSEADAINAWNARIKIINWDFKK